jgi:hypothetical protein
MCGGESLLSFDVGIVLGTELLQNKEGAHTHEGVRRGFGGDDRLDVAVPRVEGGDAPM